MQLLPHFFRLLVIVNSRPFTTTGSSPSRKTFRPVTSPGFGDVELCSTEQPSRVLNVSDILLQIEMLGLLTMMPTIPIHVLCADHCTAEQDCTGFNYKQDVGQCQMYNEVPTLCTVQRSCVHFTMNSTRACQDSYSDCVVNALAWGGRDTTMQNGYINVTRNTASTKITNGRGFNIVELDVSKCSISDVHNFDTWESSANSQQMANYIKSLLTLTVLIGVTIDDANDNLNTNGKSALLSIGVNVTGLQFRGKVAFVAQVGRPALTVMKMGPPFGDNVKIGVNARGAIFSRELNLIPIP